MKILLISPPYYREKIFIKSLKNVGAVLPPLGTAYIAAVLEKNGYEVKIIDGAALSTKLNYGYGDLEKDLKKFQPEIVGVTSTSSQISYAKKTLDLVKKVLPNTITFLGGYHITALPETVKQISSLDYGIYGEAELTFLEVVKKIEKNKRIEGTEGVIWEKNKKIHFKERPYIQNLDDLPFPARHLLNMKLYKPSPANYRRLPATTIMTSRGCPHQCIFCHKPIFGYRFRAHSAKRVLDEIELLIKDYGIRDIQIFDDTFTFDKKRTEEICKGIIERNLDIVWNCMTRVDTVDRDLLRWMHRAGCYEVGYGVESGSSRILKMIKKGVTKDVIRNAVKWAKQEKIDVRAFFVMGFPTETKEDLLKTIDFAKELNPYIAQFMVATPYPDTELWDMCKKHGKIDIDDWSNFTLWIPKKENVPFISKEISPKELISIYKKAFRSYYLRPRYIFSQLVRIRSFSDVHRSYLAAKSILGL